ncbi:VOC family protein [Gilvimarinus xylanilyticus]|uniref:VOC family protein n=1 Tax=Gilvimarinus xylanilyticus TaxID=2944139 RepID=A0A9X2HXR6_9GAMM|nr:VOC family protein [Gilvimarinus xylanilyticus]MCP8900040.1 VOC family protein [Gilvimarinus xylanilyticus]
MKRLGLWIVSLALLTSCAQTQVDLPAVVDSADTRLPGKIIWHDLISAQPEASQTFYQTLFGWQFEKLTLNTGFFSTSRYYLIRHNGELIGGMVDQADLNVKGNASQWVPVFASADIDQSAAAVDANGGERLGPIFDLRQRGRMAVAQDGQGALFAMLQTPEGDPADAGPAAPGGFLWNELWTTEVPAAREFYAAVMPYQVEQKSLRESVDYTLLKAQQKPRAGILKKPVEGIGSNWITYIRVANAQSLEAIVAQVEGLGGRVLLPIEAREAGGLAALIAGPSGAGIALQTWPVDNKE